MRVINNLWDVGSLQSADLGRYVAGGSRTDFLIDLNGMTAHFIRWRAAKLKKGTGIVLGPGSTRRSGRASLLIRPAAARAIRVFARAASGPHPIIFLPFVRVGEDMIR